MQTEKKSVKNKKLQVCPEKIDKARGIITPKVVDPYTTQSQTLAQTSPQFWTSNSS